MSKWADYAVSAVSFNAKHTHIDKAELRKDNGESLAAPQQNSRQEIIAAIKKGTTFITVFKDKEGKWEKGKQVYIITVKGTEYIKTVENSKEEDNLDNLPEF